MWLVAVVGLAVPSGSIDLLQLWKQAIGSGSHADEATAKGPAVGPPARHWHVLSVGQIALMWHPRKSRCQHLRSRWLQLSGTSASRFWLPRLALRSGSGRLLTAAPGMDRVLARAHGG